MQVQPAGDASLFSVQDNRLAQDKNVQSVFSAILAEAGRAGYASAAPLTLGDEQGLGDQAASAWDDWFRSEQTGRYASLAGDPTRDELGADFGELIQKAIAEGGYVDPKGFLSRLSTDELTTLQRVQWLADPIDVNGLTDEGALNLLIPPAAQVDANRDGLTQTGAAFGIQFPDSNTPPDVVAAWEKTTEGMSLLERMTYELKMKLPLLTANIVNNDDGTFSHIREPGDPDFVNPFDGAGADFYTKMASDWIKHLDYFQHQLDPVHYEKDRAFWQAFGANLEQ